MLIRTIGGTRLCADLSDTGSSTVRQVNVRLLLERLVAQHDLDRAREAVRPVTAEHLVTNLFQGDRSRRKEVQRAATHLRHTADPYRADRGPLLPLGVTSACNESAYVLDVEPDEIDIGVFRRAATQLLDAETCPAEQAQARDLIRSIWPDPTDQPYPSFANLGEDTSGYECPVETSRAELIDLRRQVQDRLVDGRVAITDGFSVDEALAETPTAIFGQENDTEWRPPVLFLHVNDGGTTDLILRGDKGAVPEPVSILNKCGRLTQWATGVRSDRDSKGWSVALALLVVSGLVALSSLKLGIGTNFDGPNEEGELVAYNGFLKTLNWPFILLLAPLTAWLLINFLIATDQAVAAIDGWLAPRQRNGPTFSAKFEPKFHRFWQAWRYVAPLLVLGLIVGTEQNDWFSPINDGAAWDDLDWSVAIRIDGAHPAAVLLAFNTAVFLIEVYMVSFALLALGVAVCLAGSAAGAWNKKHWLRANFRVRDKQLPNLHDVRVSVWFFLSFMTLTLVVAIMSTVENARSESGKDLGVILLALAAIVVPIASSLVVGILWYLRSKIGITEQHVTLDPLTKGLAMLLAVLVLSNTILLIP